MPPKYFFLLLFLFQTKDLGQNPSSSSPEILSLLLLGWPITPPPPFLSRLDSRGKKGGKDIASEFAEFLCHRFQRFFDPRKANIGYEEKKCFCLLKISAIGKRTVCLAVSPSSSLQVPKSRDFVISHKTFFLFRPLRSRTHALTPF